MTDEAAAASERRPIRAIVGNVVLLLAAPVCVATVLPFLPGWWVADLFSHFRVQCALVLLAALIVSRADRRRLAVLGTFFAINAVLIVGLFFAPRRVSPSPADTTIVAANLLSDNEDVSSVLAFIDAEDPDVIGLLEYTPRWQRDLSSLRERYPYSLEDPRSDNFGIALFSRHEFDGGIVVYGDAGVPTADVVLANGLRVIATHPLPPAGAAYAHDRDSQLDALAEAAVGDGRVVIVGDLNATPFSRPFRRLLHDGELRRASRGWNPTWPDGFPPLWIALDHALVGADVHIVDSRVGPSVGSDHAPIVLRAR